MRKISLQNAVALSMSAVSIVLSIVFVLLFYFSYYYFADQELKNTLVDTSTELSTQYFIFADNEIKYLDQQNQVSITDLLKSRDLSAVIFSANGRRVGTFGIYRLLFDSQPSDVVTIKNAIEQTEKSQKPTFVHLNTLDTTYELYTSPLVYDNQVVGYLQLSKQYSMLHKIQMLNVWLLVLVLPPAILLVWVVIHLIIKKFFSPLTRLVQLLSSISVDTLPQKLQTKSPFNEIHSLVDSCNVMIDRLKLGIERQKHFTAYASHELNTPLTRTVTDIELALMQIENSVQAKQHLESSQDELQKVADLLQGLLLLIQPSKAKEQYQTSVEYVFNELMTDFSAAITAKELGVEVVPTKGIFVAVHPAHFKMMIRNIFSNAVKYSPKAGLIQIGLKIENAQLTITIIDRGIGMADFEQQYVFSPFFRTEGAAHHDGSGIGLSLVRQIADLYGIELSLKSTEGKGTVVTMGGIKVSAGTSH